MTIEIDTITGPEWAICYLVNGDNSSLSEEEITLVDTWVKNILPWRVVSTESDESWFGTCPITKLGTQLCTYVVHKTKNPCKELLENTFPWLTESEDHDLSGADVIQDLENLYKSL